MLSSVALPSGQSNTELGAPCSVIKDQTTSFRNCPESGWLQISGLQRTWTSLRKKKDFSTRISPPNFSQDQAHNCRRALLRWKSDSIYITLREVSLWRFPKDTHTSRRKHEKGSHLCTRIAWVLTIAFLGFTSHHYKSTHDMRAAG